MQGGVIPYTPGAANQYYLHGPYGIFGGGGGRGPNDPRRLLLIVGVLGALSYILRK